MKETTKGERDMLLGEVADEAMGTIQEWLKRWCREDHRADSPGEEVRIRYYEDGTTVVELDDEPVMGIRFKVTVTAVDFANKINQPIQGRIQSQWDKVPSGWFVETPKGDWLEVGHTSLQAGGVQHVSLIINGQEVVFPRDPKGEVWIRRGSMAPKDMSDAMAALEEAFTTAILHDEPPGQS